MRLLLRIVITLAVPIVLTMLVVRVVTLPWYPAWEYRRAGFPPDPLGMSREDRLQLARLCIHFLNLPRGSGLLEDLRLPDGSLAFNARELSHMEDVKKVYDQLTRVALLALVLAAASVAVLLHHRDLMIVWGAFSDGGLLTLLLLLILGAWMGVGFEMFFTAFHGVFFEGDSWLFAYDDTLIRLFPLRFWYDAGMLIATVVGCIALALALWGRAMQKRRTRRSAAC